MIHNSRRRREERAIIINPTLMKYEHKLEAHRDKGQVNERSLIDDRKTNESNMDDTVHQQSMSEDKPIKRATNDSYIKRRTRSEVYQRGQSLTYANDQTDFIDKNESKEKLKESFDRETKEENQNDEKLGDKSLCSICKISSINNFVRVVLALVALIFLTYNLFIVKDKSPKYVYKFTRVCGSFENSYPFYFETISREKFEETEDKENLKVNSMTLWKQKNVFDSLGGIKV